MIDIFKDKKEVIIEAVAISGGGGRVLLNELLKVLSKNKVKVTLYINPQTDIIQTDAEIVRTKNSILNRIKLLLTLSKTIKKESTLLMFGNLPPFTKPKCEVYVFSQNRYIFEPIQKGKYSNKQLIKIYILKTWFLIFASKTYQYIVQTESMKKLLKDFKNLPNIIIAPYSEEIILSKIHNLEFKDYDKFIYVASGENHKNHKLLIQTWEKLQNKPKLILVLSRQSNPQLYDNININSKELNIELINKIDRYELLNLINESITIFPSEFESYGLPLVEAMSLKSPIIANNADYVHDVSKPIYTFNIDDIDSIKDAVLKARKKFNF